MRIYMLSVYEEHGSHEIEAFSKPENLDSKVEAYLKARNFSDESIFYAKNRVKRRLEEMTVDPSLYKNESVALVDSWGGPELHIIDVED